MVCAASQCEAVEVCQPSDSAVVFFFLKVAARRHVVTQAHLHICIQSVSSVPRDHMDAESITFAFR